VAKLQVFDRVSGKILGFIIACKLFLRMRMREVAAEEQIQWVLSYVQGGSADVWKENILEYLEIGNLEYEIAKEFLADLEKKFGGGDKKAVKVAELKRLEQGNKMMEEFVQKFRRVARGSKYEKRPLIKEFKQ